MWTTLGYDDNNGGEFCFSDAFHGGGRMLRPLVPRPLPSLRANNGGNFSSQYYHLANILNDQSKRELLNNDNGSCCPPPPVVVSSSRWNPTAEQLRILEELYRRGTRTPSSEQIQYITAQLRRYGKIEGKNVFYWFQNHKARERQKRRRQTAAEETKYAEAEKGYEIHQTKTNCSWAKPTPPPSKICTATLSQECGKAQRTKVVELEEEEGGRKRETVERDGTWNCYTVNCQLINPTRKTQHQHLNGVVESPNGDRRCNVVVDVNDDDDDDDDDAEESDQTMTLQLFPLRSTKFYKYHSEREKRRDDEQSDPDMIKNSTLSPSCSFQFFEFLPLKN